MKKRDCTIRVAKTKALISFAVTAKLICVFVFAYAESRFSHDAAHIFQSSSNTNVIFSLSWKYRMNEYRELILSLYISNRIYLTILHKK